MRAAKRFFLAIIFVQCAIFGAAQAETMEADLVGQLRAQGYGAIQVTHTWLGRMRIDARIDGFRREIVLNPTTGEILRDYQGAITVVTDSGGESKLTPSLGAANSGDTTRESIGDAPMQGLTTPSAVGDAPIGQE